MTVIIDYDGGNVQSVKNAVDKLGYPSVISADREMILNADNIIFPGQGHFGACIAALKEKGLVDVVREVARTKPFLGICVGMQLLFERSEEAIHISGLGILEGEVKKFSQGQKLPQMGWNKAHSRDKGRFDGKYFYYANSYYCVPKNKAVVLATSDYGGPFACAIANKKLFAVQFHPEKSGMAGINVLGSFLRGEYVN